MDIKLILLDLDGTLLTSDKKISPANYAALERAHEKGVHIVPSTGRFFDGIPQVVRDLPFVRLNTPPPDGHLNRPSQTP